MRRSTVLYALWCMAVLFGLWAANRHGYSPFASAGRPVLTRGAYGPQHK